jgi:hypothetical protein
MDCEKKTKYCNGIDVKLVQMKSASARRISKLGTRIGGNVYEGEKLKMCSGCRSSENGQFKIIK